MARSLTIALLVFAVVAAISREALARDPRFRIEGNASAISPGDIDAVVAAVAPNSIYRLRVISHNRVHVETSGYRVENIVVNGRLQMRTVPYLVVDRVGGRWRIIRRETTVLQ
jgi:hypothetical protein